MKFLVTICYTLVVTIGSAQVDTVVVKDYAKVLITTDNSGAIIPVTELGVVKQAGFFLNGMPEGKIRICNDDELSVWTDGKLLRTLSECEFIDPKLLFQFSKKDTIYMSFSAASKFENFRCELVIFEEYQLLRDESSKPRNTRSAFQEFNIIALIILLCSFAIFTSSFPSRLTYFLSKTFSLKASAYQFTNTSFFYRANVYMAFIVCMTIAYEIIYIDQKIDLAFVTSPVDLGEFLLLWSTITAWIFSFYFVKRFLVQIVAGLFNMRKLRDWQLFDLVNFMGYFVLVLFIVVLWDFILKSSGDSWISSYFSSYFIFVLLLFEIWFIAKFVTNSSYQKLLIISYLCATELIPAIFIMVWFFK